MTIQAKSMQKRMLENLR